MPLFKILPDQDFRELAQRELERFRRCIAHTGKLVEETEVLVRASYEQLGEYE
jgi:hypothetical protein